MKILEQTITLVNDKSNIKHGHQHKLFLQAIKAGFHHQPPLILRVPINLYLFQVHMIGLVYILLEMD